MKIPFALIALLFACWPTLLLDAADLPVAPDSIPQWTDAGFRVPQPGIALSAPAALASWPDYRIEWWYLTGHLEAGNRRFGYQATFFRYALKNPSGREADGAAFGRDHLHLTHMALVDAGSDRFYYQQRLHRNGWDAHAATDRPFVHHGNWQLQAVDPQTERWQLQASVGGDIALQLELRAQKPLIQFGPDGTSRKGADPASRSYYLTYTRLQTSGTLHIGAETFDVTGSSWMDHEKASSQLEPGYVGWDWIAIQLEDGWEVKAYLLRDAQNLPSPFSSLIWISPDAEVTYRGRDDFSWEVNRTWLSPHSGARYPHTPRIRTVHPRTGEPVTLQFHPLRDDQELNLPGTVYWEGAGDILDGNDRRIGRAYLELVGYAGPIEGLR